MEEINEIKIPKGVDRISVKQHDDKIVIEFIAEKPKFNPKFNPGDKVRIKDGVSSKTHRNASYKFMEDMDKYIGQKLTVAHVGESAHYGIYYTMTNGGYSYAEDWLEPYTEELKKGDLVIFWDNDDNESASIRMYDRKDHSGYYDSCGFPWDNAIKFESKEQFEKILRGEV